MPIQNTTGNNEMCIITVSSNTTSSVLPVPLFENQRFNSTISINLTSAAK